MAQPVFIAYAVGPPRLRLWLYRDDDFEYRGAKRRGGWHIVVDRMQGNDWVPHVDYSEQEFTDIRCYPLRFADAGSDFVWRDEITGEVVNLDEVAA